MKTIVENTENSCRVSEIADYLDGELSAKSENEIELHLLACKICRNELNFQKQFLTALDFELKDLPELPADFTKTTIINAESSVQGLRCRGERSRAVFICAGLFLLIILGLGSETKSVFSAFGHILNQILAVGGFVLHFLFDLTVGLTVILKFIGHQFSHKTFFAVIFCAAVIISGLFVISRSKLVFSRS